MDTELRELEFRWKATGDLEDLKIYFSSLLRMGQTEPALELLHGLAPIIKSQLLIFVGEPSWRKIVNEHYQNSGTLYGFLFLPSKLIEEAEVLLQIANIEDWKEEQASKANYGDSSIYLGRPQADYSRSFIYHFEDSALLLDTGVTPTGHYIEVIINSGSTNYWINSSLWMIRSGYVAQDMQLMVSDPGETLAGSYFFEYIKGRKVFDLEILPLED